MNQAKVLPGMSRGAAPREGKKNPTTQNSAGLFSSLSMENHLAPWKVVEKQ